MELLESKAIPLLLHFIILLPVVLTYARGLIFVIVLAYVLALVLVIVIVVVIFIVPVFVLVLRQISGLLCSDVLGCV